MHSEAQGWRPQTPRVAGVCGGGTGGRGRNETWRDLTAERMDWTQEDAPGTRFSQTPGDAPVAKATGLSSETNARWSGILSDSWPEVSPLLPGVDVCLSEQACVCPLMGHHLPPGVDMCLSECPPVRPLRGQCLPPGVAVCPPPLELASPTRGGRVSVPLGISISHLGWTCVCLNSHVSAP